MTETPKGYVDSDYLCQAASLFAPIKARSHALLALQSGDRVLDVGCGAGVDLPPLQLRVGEGLAVGVDQDHEMTRQASACGVAVTAVAGALPFASGSLQGCRAERVFMHLLDPLQVLTEMYRVLSPDGRLVLVETDWGSCSLNCQDAQLEQRLNRFRAEHLMNGGYCARQLYGLCREVGFSDVQCEIHPLLLHDRQLYDRLARLQIVEDAALASGVITAAELQRWRQDLDQAGEYGSFFATVNVVMVVGRRRG